MDYHSKFEFDQEIKENINLENIPDHSLDSYVQRNDEYIKKMPMIETSFSQINELAANLGKHKHNLNNLNTQTSSNRKDKLIKCYYSQNIEASLSIKLQGSENGAFLSMYTPGGFRYFASIRLPILKVFPLEDGVLIKWVYDQKLLHVDFTKQDDRLSFAYFTLTKHPLGDLRPLSMIGPDLQPVSMIDTMYDVLFVSDQIPVCVLFDDTTNEIIFAILRSNEEHISSIDYIESLKHNESRHHMIKHISNTPEILIDFIDSEIQDPTIRPNQFEIVNSFEENEFVIVMHYSLLNQTKFYQWSLEEEKNIFTATMVQQLDNTRCIGSFEFLKQHDLSDSKIWSFTSSRKLYNKESEYIRSKVKSCYDLETIVLFNDSSIQIFKGYLPLLELHLKNGIHSLIPIFKEDPTLEIVNFSNPKNTRVTLHLNNGETVRYDFQFKSRMRDQTLQLWLEIMKVVLPLSVYYKFYEHFVFILWSGNKGFNEEPTAWEVFTELFFWLVDKNLSEPKIPTQTIDLHEQSLEFDKMINSKTGHKIWSKLKLKLPKIVDQSIQSKSTFNRSFLALKRFGTIIGDDDLACFQKCSEDLFSIFHLLQEDMRLNIFNSKFIKNGKFSDFLFRFCLKRGPNKFAYSEYYIRENPGLLDKYQKEYAKYKNEYKIQLEEAKLLMIQNKSNSNFKIPLILSEPLSKVPSIYSWIESKLDQNQSTYDSEYFCFFETTRKVCRLYEIFASEGKDEFLPTSKIHRLLTKSKYDMEPTDLCNSNSGVYPLFCLSEDWSTDKYSFDSQTYYMVNINMNLFEKIVFWLKEEFMGRSSIKRLPLGISLPIQEVLTHDYFSTIYVKSSNEQRQQIKEWPKEMFKLIEREDLYYNLQELKNKEINAESSVEFQFSRVSNLKLDRRLSKRKSMLKLGRADSNIFNQPSKSITSKKQAKDSRFSKQDPTVDNESEEQKYMDLIDKEFKSLGFKNKNETHIFNSDLRYQEVCSILDSSIPFKIRIDKVEGIDQMANDKIEEVRNVMHDYRVVRQYAKCIGRGALKLGTIHTVPTEKLQIPSICKTGLMPPDNKKFEYKEESNNLNKKGWSDFHNGVATGLQLATEFDPFSNQIKNWILYHKPSEPKDDFGGFLMAMGFHGYLKGFLKVEIYQYMKSKHEAQTVGFLLGGAASRIGTSDEIFSRALCINISFLHPRGIEIDISTTIQCAALVGEGLLFKGSNDRLATEMMLTQISKGPINNKNTDRESYALSAGFALGLVNLGSGSKLPGMSDLNMDERLIRFIEGGKRMEDLPSMKPSHDSEKCSSVKEGDNVNLYVTLPGAIMALTFMHLKSNNKQVADRIELPKTFHSLEYSRPRDVLLKVLCKNMIMWDSIEATKMWIDDQIPEIIRFIFNEKNIENIEKQYQTRISVDEIDFSSIAILHTYFLSGTLFSIGFKYAGSGNSDVFKFLNMYIEKIIGMRITDSSKFQANICHRYTNYNKNDIDNNTYETWLCVAAFAISMVMAGTGDTECFVTLRRIRKILETNMHYGFMMAIHMAIGFLFLGSGKYTLSTSNLSIASLLMALYPVFPETTEDNRHHLQALRHFYVLAIECRLLQAVNIESGEFVSVPLQIDYKPNKNTNRYVQEKETTRQVKTPIMLEDMHKISRIRLTDKQYYEVTIEKPENIATLNHGSHSVFARSSKLEDQPHFANKSISKVSSVIPFDVNADSINETHWIPKLIYVKKCLPLECENSDKALSGKSLSVLAPFEFSEKLATNLEKMAKSKNRLYSDSEMDDEYEEDEQLKLDIRNVTTSLNTHSEFIASITQSPVIKKFLQSMCTFESINYSELEPSVILGLMFDNNLTDGLEHLSDKISNDDFFETLEITEDLTEELEGNLNKHRAFNKNFYLGILNECFLNNKIEVLPVYIKLFNSSVEFKNSENIKDLIKEGKLICTFYKGLYENKFNINEQRLDEDDDEEMEDVNSTQASKLQSQYNEVLLKKEFVEELEEVLDIYNKDESVTKILDDYISNEMNSELGINDISYSDIMRQIGTRLNYKKYPFISEMQSLLILLETTRGYNRQSDGKLIWSLFKQKFGNVADLLKF